jgi:hypothetical protein
MLLEQLTILLLRGWTTRLFFGEDSDGKEAFSRRKCTI